MRTLRSTRNGEDPPRAFVLASTKPVNDVDFAMQFIGRVMRVAPELQQAFPLAYSAPTELDTAYVYLGNAQAQGGFAEAARSTSAVQSQLEGQVEALHAFRTAQGGMGLSNRPTPQTPLSYDLSFMPSTADAAPDGGAALTPPGGLVPHRLPPGVSLPLFDMTTEGITVDEFLQPSAARRRTPGTREELYAAFDERGLRALPRRALVARYATPNRLTTELRPDLDALTLNVQQAAHDLPLSPELELLALRAALNELTEPELHRELFGGASTEEQVQVFTNRQLLNSGTLASLEKLGLEEQDQFELVAALARRLLPPLIRRQNGSEGQEPSPKQRLQARDAACWVLRRSLPEVSELLQAQWAQSATEAEAAPLPDALLLPAGLVPENSPKNTYGVVFPAADDLDAAAATLSMEAQRHWRSDALELSGEPAPVSLARLDKTYTFNSFELAFARALDAADFVAWWHRNPQGKPYSVALVRSDSPQMFHPDFIVCLHHDAGDKALLRLVETKHDVKDAQRKGRRASSTYGKVLFLTEDASRVRIVEDDGSLGDAVAFDNLARLRRWMIETRPH